MSHENPATHQPESAGHAHGDAHAPAHGHHHGHGHSHGHDHEHLHEAPTNPLRRYLFSTDHKVIGIQFLFSGLIWFVLGGLLALAVRWQLAWPWSPMPLLSKALWADPSLGYRMPPEYYNKLFTMHATIMIFFVIIPLLTGAFGNFLIPLMIGARDMAFPKLNMFSYWAMPPAMILIAYSFYVEGGSAEAGWTSYPILSVAKSSTSARPTARPVACSPAVRGRVVVDGVDQLHHDDPGCSVTGHEDGSACR
ncbi:MAG: cbb3-type cytochrome c oxidase subunit I [Isosphaeraceae bacterium]